MEENIVIYKASDFTYPTKEELEFASKLIPNLHTFEYEYISDIEALTCSDSELKLIFKKNHLFCWNLYLRNKIGKFQFAYTNSITYYKRGIPSKDDNQDSKLYINLIQFYFYSETFYYFLISVRDIILQIINVYFDLGFEEDKVSQDKIITRLGDQPVAIILRKYKTQLKNYSDIRHSLTHRFSVNEPDYRFISRKKTYEPSNNIFEKIKRSIPEKFRENNPNTNNVTSHTLEEFGLGAGSHKGKEPNEIYDDMINACGIMSNFIQELKTMMIPI